jgi:NADH:ubiquinone oxidoreductase subunit 6 (subunit J)
MASTGQASSQKPQKIHLNKSISYCVVSSLAMIFSRNAAKAVLFLILAFFSAASIWLLLEAEFLAITLILVYVGDSNE